MTPPGLPDGCGAADLCPQRPGRPHWFVGGSCVRCNAPDPDAPESDAARNESNRIDRENAAGVNFKL
jgi:hypothetical protein